MYRYPARVVKPPLRFIPGIVDYKPDVNSSFILGCSWSDFVFWGLLINHPLGITAVFIGIATHHPSSINHQFTIIDHHIDPSLINHQFTIIDHHNHHPKHHLTLTQTINQPTSTAALPPPPALPQRHCHGRERHGGDPKVAVLLGAVGGQGQGTHAQTAILSHGVPASGSMEVVPAK